MRRDNQFAAMPSFDHDPVPDSLPAAIAPTVLRVADAVVMALPEGGLWIEAARTLVVSDLHFEKGSSYAARGQMLPPYDTAATLTVVEALVRRWKPERVVSLGDSFHDMGAAARLSSPDAERIRELTSLREWIWIEGNHDPVPPLHLGGVVRETISISGLVLRHLPGDGDAEICGHLHPCAKIAGRARRVRTRAFVTNGRRLVMPSMGRFTGGLNVLSAAFQPLFPDGMRVHAMGRDRVYAISPTRLVADISPGGPRWRL